MLTSKQKASVCRMVHVYHREHGGPMAGVVVGSPLPDVILDKDDHVVEDDGQNVSVNVLIDGLDNERQELLQRFRQCPEGNTISAPLYDALSEEDREVVKPRHQWWAEWPPREQPPARTQPDGAPAEQAGTDATSSTPVQE